jgi:hypothetical protein
MLGKIGEIYSSWREKLQKNRCNNATQSWVNELFWNDVQKTLKRKVLLQTQERRGAKNIPNRKSV